MINRSVFQRLSFVTLCVVLIGCSKKEQSAATQSEAPTAAQPAVADSVSQPPSGPVLDASQMGDAKAAMAEADLELRQREYEKAVRTMLAIQQAQLSAQQAEAARQQMRAFQRNLANAVASGDANAKAAADLLRAGHSR